MQVVNLGITQTGVCGVFSGGMLVVTLHQQQYQEYKANPAAFASWCKFNRFKPA